MLRANGRAVLALGLLVSLFAACSLTVDLEGYAGGTKDAGAVDAGSDADTGAQTDTTVFDGAADSRADSLGADADAADSLVDSLVDSSADTAGDVEVDAATDGPVDGDAGPSCHPVINEVVTGLALPGSATDEFVELYNPCPTAISIATWKIAYRSSAGASESTLAALTGSLPSGGYLLLASTGGYFSKTPYTPDATFSSGLAGAGGGIGLRDDKGALVDSLAWGDAVVGHPFAETTKKAAASTSAPPGQGLARTPNGKDTNDNSADFAAATPTPKAAN